MPLLFTTHVDTPLGPLLAAAVEDRNSICLLEFADQPQRVHAHLTRLERRFSSATTPLTGSLPIFNLLRQELDEYFTGQRLAFDLPLLYPGTSFQQSVWDALRAIPYGETRTYAEMAAQLNHPQAARAVGAANGRNPLSILIPCHRLIRKNGGLGGYGGGLWRKQRLLQLEQALDAAGAAGSRMRWTSSG